MAIELAAARPRQQVPRPGRLERAKQAALELAREGGYEAVTMPAVADRSGVSRANLYQHFVSKDHLLAAAFVDIAEVQISRPSSATLAAPTAGERVLAFFDQCIAGALVNPQFVEAYLRAITRAPNEVVASIPNVWVNRMEEVLGPNVRNRSDIALVLELAFSALIVGVVGRGASVEDVRDTLQRTVKVVLGRR